MVLNIINPTTADFGSLSGYTWAVGTSTSRSTLSVVSWQSPSWVISTVWWTAWSDGTSIGHNTLVPAAFARAVLGSGVRALTGSGILGHWVEARW